jgi:hypothetical protein
MHSNCTSVLLGNGLDVQVGGDDYLNKWIIVRLLAKAKMGEYDTLFTDSLESSSSITGEEIVELFSNMLVIANKARKKEYRALAKAYGNKDLLDTLNDFECNYTYEIRSIEEIGMEDWFLIFLLYLIENADIIDQYKLIKQGLDLMIIDAIYCEGDILKLHSKMNSLSKIYFSNFDNIFTLNYDDSIEKLTNKRVFHLHGDLKTKKQSESPQNAYGYLRIQNGQNIWFPSQFEHCYCSAILDYNGNLKYNYATQMTQLFLYTETIKETAKKDKDEFKKMLQQIPTEQHELINTAVNKNLYLGHDYHFQDFEQISGTLKIIGLSPKNDSHIFQCINKSNINNVIFYHYFGPKRDDEIEAEKKSLSLPINKPYIIENVKKIWDEIRVHTPNKLKYNLTKKQLELLNVFCPQQSIGMNDILRQLNSIPTVTRKIIFEMMTFEISKSKYHNTPKNDKEFFANFIEFGKTLEVAALSPQTLYHIYLTELSKNNNHNKIQKRKHKK